MRAVSVLAAGGEAGAGISTAAAAMFEAVSYDGLALLADENAYLRRVIESAIPSMGAFSPADFRAGTFDGAISRALDTASHLGAEPPNNRLYRSLPFVVRSLATWTAHPMIQEARARWLDSVVGKARKNGAVLVLAAQHARERIYEADLEEARVALDLHLACTDDVAVARYFGSKQDGINEQAWGEGGSRIWLDRNQSADPYSRPFYTIPYEHWTSRSATINASRGAPFSPDNIAPIGINTDGMTLRSLKAVAGGLAILALA